MQSALANRRGTRLRVEDRARLSATTSHWQVIIYDMARWMMRQCSKRNLVDDARALDEGEGWVE